LFEIQITKKCDVMAPRVNRIDSVLLSAKNNSSAGSSSGKNKEVNRAGMGAV
jgi:hypothetical protein